MVEVEEFLKKYQAQAMLSTHKMYAKPRYQRFDDWHITSTQYMSSVDLEREPYVEMYVPQEHFQRLVEKDRYYTNLSKENNYAMSVVNQMIQDEVVRKQNPAVEKAWRNYQMLLELARK
jgi:hypothetical protein